MKSIALKISTAIFKAIPIICKWLQFLHDSSIDTIMNAIHHFIIYIAILVGIDILTSVIKFVNRLYQRFKGKPKSIEDDALLQSSTVTEDIPSTVLDDLGSVPLISEPLVGSQIISFIPEFVDPAAGILLFIASVLLTIFK